MSLSQKICICLIAFSLLLLPSQSVCQSEQQQDEVNVIFSAMKDELNRSMSMLQMEDLEKPYYISYKIQEDISSAISASFGALISSNHNKSRILAVDVRVGDYSFDNRNFSDFGSVRLSVALSTLDTDYSVIRQDLWRATDLAYKNALEMITKKRAAIQTQEIEEKIDDFEKIEPISSVEVQPIVTIDKTEWETRLKRLSEIFKDFMNLDETRLNFSAIFSRHFFLNSEERKFHFSELIISLDVFIAGRAEDGTKVINAKRFHARSLNDFPSETELADQIRALAEETELLRSSPIMEDYDGPILLKGEPAAEFFILFLTDDISDNRVPIMEDPRRQSLASQSKLSRKLNRRVAADLISAVDDPTMTHFNGIPMIGTYSIDDEGIKPDPLQIIENGILKNYYMSRIPTKHFSHTNGHGRASLGYVPVGRIGNLIISAEDGLSPDSLKKEFIQLCRDEGLEYGIMVSRFLSPAHASTASNMGFPSSYRPYASREVLVPIMAYKVYVDDGREELIRGFEIIDVKVRLMRDILYAGNDAAVYNYFDFGPSGRIAATVVAPSIVLEEVEIRKIQQKPMKAPLLKNPYIKKYIPIPDF